MKKHQTVKNNTMDPANTITCVVQTVKEMLADRLCLVNGALPVTNEETGATQWSFVCPPLAVCVMINLTIAKLGVSDLAKMQEAGKKQASRLILVCNNFTTKSKKNLLSDPTSESFFTNELIVNRSKHRDVPRHSIVRGQERARVARNAYVAESDLSQFFPLIQTDDFMCRYLGGQAGDLVQIERQRGITYRVVVRKAP